MAAYIDTAAVGVLRGAGPPLEQLALGPDEWQIHTAVVHRANRMWMEEQQKFVQGLGGDLTIIDVAAVLDEEEPDGD